MIGRLTIPEHDRRLIPEGRINGPMPWMIAIMVLLTLLAAAAGLALDNGARSVAAALASKATVQIVEPAAALRHAQKQAAVERLRDIREVVAIDPVSDSEARGLLEPWLGKGGITDDIPIPALIDVRFDDPPGPRRLDEIRAVLLDVAPSARIDSQVELVEPVAKLMRWLVWLALGLVVLLLIATAATVVLAARSALNSHGMTIDTIHMLGATDRQIASLFQRRIALDAAFGGLVGLLGGLIVIILFGAQIGRVRSALFETATLPWYAYAVLLLLPLGAVAVASLVARFTVLRAVRKTL